jgi:hypothetical protein
MRITILQHQPINQSINPMSSQQPPIDFQAEETELYELCTTSNAAVYKWFDLIKVDLQEGSLKASVYFGKAFEDDEVPKEVAKQIRSYVKDQKRAIRENPRGFSPEEGRRKIFWLLTMFLQHGVFPRCIGKIETYATFVYCQTKEDE